MSMNSFKFAAVGIALAGGSLLTPLSAKADAFTVTVEAPGVQNTTATFSTVGTEGFDSSPIVPSSPLGGPFEPNSNDFSTDYGTAGVITGSYSNFAVLPADQYGGAGGSGYYVGDYNGGTVANPAYSVTSTLSLSTTLASGINYFGVWISALDDTNLLDFYKGATLVYQFTPTDLLALVGANPAYFGNPTPDFLGQNGDQPYAFVNFFDTDGTFDSVVFGGDPIIGGQFETDNHTVGYFTTTSGTDVSVPEPASLALLGAGLAGLGFLRRKKS